MKQSGGLGFCTVLFLIFLTLKLCDVIAWSWLWVTAPLWMPLGLLVLVVLASLMLIGFVTCLERPNR